jgi:hypothetical protein
VIHLSFLRDEKNWKLSTFIKRRDPKKGSQKQNVIAEEHPELAKRWLS